MKIGIDARMLGYSGIGRYTENLIRRLLKIDKKNKYTVFVQKGQSQLKIENLKLKIVKTDAPIYSFKEQYNFLRAVNGEKLDTMHFTHFNRPIFYNRPSVVTIHDLTPIYFPGKKRKSFVEQFAYRLVLKTALKKASKIIAVSNYTKKDLIKNFPFLNPDKIVVIYEGVEEKLKIENLKLKIDKPYLLYVGVWREHKNLLGLIKAFEKIKSEIRNPKSETNSKFKIQNSKQFLNLKLVIVGKPDPYYLEIPEAVKKSPFKNDIILTGLVSDEELPALYQNAEAFIFPSFCEGFGLPALEAMTSSIPVISSNTTSLPEVLGDAALYFNPHNPQDMAEKIKQVLENRELRESLIKQGLEQVKKYSWKKMARETLKLYNEIGG